MTVPLDVLAFDVERGLATALKIKCETFLCSLSSPVTKIRIGGRWNLVVDREQLEFLWDNVDNPSALKEAFDSLKAECLAFKSLQR